eukprot:6857753-Pyramimonas_sp.AAC.1
MDARDHIGVYSYTPTSSGCETCRRHWFGHFRPQGGLAGHKDRQTTIRDETLVLGKNMTSDFWAYMYVHMYVRVH